MKTKKTLEKFVNEAIYENNPVHGITHIIHKVRHALSLTMDEYAMTQLIETINNEKKTIDYQRIFTRIGIKDERQVDSIIKSLFEKKMLKKEGGIPVITELWLDAHKNDVDQNFEEFWRSTKNFSWPGSKPAAREMYEISYKLTSHEYLLKQKLAYFDFLNLPENAFRSIMQAKEFLNPKSKRYDEEWKQQGDSIIARRNGSSRKNDYTESNLTKDEHRKMFL